MAIQETQAIQKSFSAKREYALKRVRELGIQIAAEPQGSFYLWANLENLPAGINDGLAFFEEGLKEKVITVPVFLT